MLQRAIDDWHALLTDETAQETGARLDAQLRQRGLDFGDRSLCTVLRPRFFSAQQYGWLQRRAALVLRAFGTAYRAAMADDAVLDQFGLTDWERRLVRWDPGFADPSPVSRLDAFFVTESGGLRFTEYNAETPAGGAWNDVLTETFFGLPVARAFVRTWEMRPLPARHGVLHGLMSAYRQWAAGRGAPAQPRIAILDWAEVPTRNEFEHFRDYFVRQGYDAVVADPRDAEYANGRLTLGGGPVQLIYKRVLLHELVERGGVDHPVLRAVKDGAVCMVNPPRCKILHKKSSLAVLSDERNAHLFDGEEQEAIAAHIPWTRVVEERKTVLDGATVDLVPWIAEHREQLVLKPHDEYGGKGIVLGWEVSGSAWEAALAVALREPYIVQQRIPLPSEPYPSLVDGKPVFADRMVDTAPYVTHGAYVDGCLTRLSTAALLNVTAGGGSQTPTFVVERR